MRNESCGKMVCWVLKILNSCLIQCYISGLHFALRGGNAHRRLRLNKNSQITGPHIDTGASNVTYLEYTKDMSKANAGGMKHRKLAPKRVRAYENPENRTECIVSGYEKYKAFCPPGAGKYCFYLTPLKHPQEDIWYSSTPVGHNTLQATVKRLCSDIGLSGKRTNHSIRASAATRLYNAGVDEQIVAERTGHRSKAVCFYKRTSADQRQESSDILHGKKGNRGEKSYANSTESLKPMKENATVTSDPAVTNDISILSAKDNSGKKTITCNITFNLSVKSVFTYNSESLIE